MGNGKSRVRLVGIMLLIMGLSIGGALFSSWSSYHKKNESENYKQATATTELRSKGKGTYYFFAYTVDGMRHKMSRLVDFDVGKQAEIKYNINNPRDIIIVGHTGVTYFPIGVAILTAITGILLLCGKFDHAIKVRENKK